MNQKRIILIFIMTFSATAIQAQHYSLYNSGTLAESVENPWVSAFEGSCGIIASNFFIPTVNGDGFLHGDAAETGREYLFWNREPMEALEDLQGKNELNLYNHLNVLTVKYLFDESTQTEFLFDHSVRSMTGATIKNLTVNLANNFIDRDSYPAEMGPANSNLFHYLYAATTLGVRRSFDESFSAGISISYLSGIAHYDSGIGYSEASYNQATDQMTLNGRGEATFTSYSKDLNMGDFMPSFRNPGLSISGGIEKKLNEIFKFSLGIKDLGGISWKEKGERVQLDGSEPIVLDNFSTMSADMAEDELTEIRMNYGRLETYHTPLPTRIEAGGSVAVHPNYTANVLLAYLTKYRRGDVNMINDFSYGDFHLILNAGYNSYQNFLLGLNFLIRSPRVDFFVGSDNLLPSVRATRQWGNENYHYNRQTAANVNFGFALRLGSCGKGYQESRWLNLRDERGRRRREKCFIF